MIETLPRTNISAVAKRLVLMRQESGVSALGRVLTLVIVATGPIDEDVIEAANHASNEHPMRVIVLLTRPFGEARLDAEIRVGTDAGASDVVVLRAFGTVVSGVESLVTGLLLPDAPVVVWWPDAAPVAPGSDPVGRIAGRRITDAAAPAGDGWGKKVSGYTAGDTDLAWTRLTRWREHLAAMLDQPPYDPVTSVEVVGSASSPSTELLAAWLQHALDAPTTCTLLGPDQPARGVVSVTLTRRTGESKLERVTPLRAALSQPGQPTHEIVLPRRSLSECLAEELRGLHEDVMYGRVLTQVARNRATNDQ